MAIESISTTQQPTAAKAATDAKTLGGDLNRFLTLLVTQLQNQDPLDPQRVHRPARPVRRRRAADQEQRQPRDADRHRPVERGCRHGQRHRQAH